MTQQSTISYRALDMLHRSYGPVRARKAPFWRPRPADPTGEVWEPRWTWDKPLTSGETVQAAHLDANGAFLGAICSVEVAHGALTRTRRRRFDRAVPGLWLVDWHPWRLGDRIVSPLGGREGLDRVWLTTPTVQLLAQLTERGVWPGVDVHDSWTSDERCRLRRWGERIRDDRERAIAHQDAENLAAIKLGYSQAVVVMATEAKAKVYRPDWAQAIRAQAAASIWRYCWSMLDSGFDVLRMANVDEVTVRWEDLPGLRREGRVIRIHDHALGSFKIKRRGVLHGPAAGRG